MSYQNTNHELSFGNENFGDDVVTHQALEMNKPYTIRMNQVKETNGQYLYTIEVDGETIFEGVNLKPYFSSSTRGPFLYYVRVKGWVGGIAKYLLFLTGVGGWFMITLT